MRNYAEDLELARSLEEYRKISEQVKGLSADDSLINSIIPKVMSNTEIFEDEDELKEFLESVFCAIEEAKSEQKDDKKTLTATRDEIKDGIEEKITKITGEELKRRSKEGDSIDFSDAIKLKGIGSISWSCKNEAFCDFIDVDKEAIIDYLVDTEKTDVLTIDEEKYLELDKKMLQKSGKHIAGVVEKPTITISIRVGKK